MSRMPEIKLESLHLTAPQLDIAKGIISTRGENKGCLRASKPKTPRKVKFEDPNALFGYRYDYADEAGRKAGMTAYVWRMVAFFVSPVSQHRCMPVMCECDLPGTASERRKLAKDLDDLIVKLIVDSIPLTQQHGTLAWGRAYGMF